MVDFSLIIQNAISGIIVKLPEFILIIWAVKIIVKEMPKWIEEYYKLREIQLKLEWAKGIKH